jgi:hypothetical protein
MSQQEISQSRLSYSRDFLLSYQHIYKPDPTIETLLRPYVVQPDNQSLIIRSQGSPYASNASARFSKVPIPKTTPVPRRKPNEGQGKIEKKSQRPPDTANVPVYKPRHVPKDLSLSQKENIEHIPLPVNDLGGGILKDPIPQKMELSHPHPYLVGLRGGTKSMQALRVGPNLERDLGKINSGFFYDAKFGTIFASGGDTTSPGNRETKFENCGVVPSTEQLLTSYNLIENPLSPIIPLVSETSGTNNQPPRENSITTTTTVETKPLHDQNTIPTGNPEPWRPVPSGDAFVTPTKNRSPNPKRTQMTPKSPNFQNNTPNNKSPYRNQGVSPSGRPISPLDEQRLLQRQKQIDYGYRTVGYLRYRLLVSKDKRKPDHPRTPKKRQGCSKRSWDGQLKKWRRDLHLWDPDNIEAFKALLNSPIVETIVAANPELADIVKTVREKLDNPNALADNESDSENEETPTSPMSPETLAQIGLGKSEIKTIEVSKTTDSRLEKVARTLVF